MNDPKHLNQLFSAYENADDVYHVTPYWADTHKSLHTLAHNIDLANLRSGQYDILRKFGFGDLIYQRPAPDSGALTKALTTLLSVLSPLARKIPRVHPYAMTVRDIQNLALHHAILAGQAVHAKDIMSVSVSKFGNPEDLFTRNGHRFTTHFLNMYMRYTFAHGLHQFHGDELIVELGQGSGTQIELLKKLYPNLTVICFDLPGPLYLCEQYLRRALGPHNIVSSKKTIAWNNLSNLTTGKVHLLGNWQFPLLLTINKIDWFWNAASFGEMEPATVQHYLSFIHNKAGHIYLLNARKGKETAYNRKHTTSIVNNKVTFDDYKRWLSHYRLMSDDTPWGALKPMSQSGGYFQAVWENSESLS